MTTISGRVTNNCSCLTAALAQHPCDKNIRSSPAASAAASEVSSVPSHLHGRIKDGRVGSKSEAGLRPITLTYPHCHQSFKPPCCPCPPTYADLEGARPSSPSDMLHPSGPRAVHHGMLCRTDMQRPPTLCLEASSSGWCDAAHCTGPYNAALSFRTLFQDLC